MMCRYFSTLSRSKAVQTRLDLLPLSCYLRQSSTYTKNDGKGNVAVVGTGLIGASWSSLFLANGYTVIASDPAAGAEDSLRAFVREQWSTLQASGYSGPCPMDRLLFAKTLEEAVKDAIFVQENGPENVDLKRKMFRDMDQMAPSHAIIASSSSGLPSSTFVTECANPSRILIGHPFNPPHLLPLVEIVPNAHTSEDVIARTRAFYLALGKSPVLLRKEVAGFAANRLQAALLRECYSLVKEGVCTVEDVNKAVSQGPGLRWALHGPFWDNHFGGGPGGIRHFMDHLGKGLEGLWNDFKPLTLDDELRNRIVSQTEEVVNKTDAQQVEKERDEMLVGMVAGKKARSTFPF